MSAPGVQTGQEAAEATRRGRLWVLAALLLLLAIGAALRLYRIERESAWYDEVITVSGIGAESLRGFFEHWRYTNWNAVPVYYTIQYFWGRHVCSSFLGFRALSVLFSLLTVPVIYLLGRHLFGRRAGLVAALCFLLSGVHIYQAQEVRNYSLTTLAAALCAYSFVRLLEKPAPSRYFWNAFANVFLVWTHLFGCYLLVAAGCTLLLFRLRRFKQTAAWFALNLALMAPSLLWITTFEPIRYYEPPPPRLWMIVNNALTDVWSPTLVFGIPPGYEWQVRPTAWTQFFAQSNGYVDNALLAVFLAAAAFAAGTMLRRRSAPAFAPDAAPSRNEAALLAFLLCWLILPGVILFALAWTWRTDIFAAKYTTYSSLAAYLLAGGAVERLPGRTLRVAAVTLLAVLFAHRYGLTLTHPQRPDWYAATDTIKADYRDGDPLVIYPDWQAQVLEYNMRPHAVRARQTGDLYHVCACADAALAQHERVWVVWVGGFGNVDFAERVGGYLMKRGLPYTRRAFWAGMACIFVFDVQRGPGYVPPSSAAVDAAYRAVTDGLAIVNDGTSAGIPVGP